MDVKILFSILASVFGLIGFVPYLWNAIFGQTRPHSFTWLIWAITNWIAVAGLWLGGGHIGAISPTISAIFATSVFFTSLRFGKRDIKKSDIVVLIAALLAIYVWLFLDNLLLAVIIASLIDVIGYIPTFRKSFKDPESEAVTSWGLLALAALFAIFALREYNLLTMSYLTAIASVNTILLAFLLIRKRALGK